MAGHAALDRIIGVRIPASQQGSKRKGSGYFLSPFFFQLEHRYFINTIFLTVLKSSSRSIKNNEEKIIDNTL